MAQGAPGSTTCSTTSIHFDDEGGRFMRLLTPPQTGARMQRSVAACLAAILELDPAEVPIPDERHPEPWTVWGQWLALRGLGLVPIDAPAGFSWPGPWLAVLKAGDGAVGAVAVG